MNNIKEFLSDKKSNVSHIEEINEIVGVALRCVAMHPVKMEIVIVDQKPDLDDILERASSLDEPDEDWIGNHSDFNSIIIENVKKISAINPCGGNSDNRGGGCTLFSPEEYYHFQQIDGSLTLLELVSIIYRLKGSKYDWWYELFSSVKAYLEDDHLYLELSFDHGS